MSQICPKCGKEYDDTALKCPFCPEENSGVVLEVPTIESLDSVSSEPAVESKIESPIVETVAEAEPVLTEQQIKTETLPVIEELVTPEDATIPVVNEQTPITENLSSPEETPLIETPSLENIMPTTVTTESPSNEKLEDEPKTEEVAAPVATNMPVIETSTLEEVSVIVPEESLEPIIENEELETVSITTPEASLEVKEEEIVIPEMPDPVVGEINPDLLGAKYDAEEEFNNEKREAKKRQEEIEAERIRQEQALKSQMPMEKPDLLARIPDPSESDVEITPTKKKGKPMKKVLNIIIIILAIAVVGVAIWHFFLQDIEKISDSNYMDPIATYFDGYKEVDSTKMLSSFVPCVAKNEDIASMITTSVQTRTQYKEVTIEYNEKTAEVVNNTDQATLDEYLKTTCGTDLPTITEYKHVYVSQKIKTEQDTDFTENNPEFWNIKIEDKWYILLVQ